LAGSSRMIEALLDTFTLFTTTSARGNRGVSASDMNLLKKELLLFQNLKA
jgi:hypothetical protein